MNIKDRPSVEDVLREHGARIERQINSEGTGYSSEYLKFKAELSPELSRYEKLCNSLGNIIRIKVSQKDEIEIKKHLETAHLDVQPWQALTLALVSFIGVFFVGLVISLGIAFLGSNSTGGLESFFSNFPFLFFFLMIILSAFLFYFVKAYPSRLANQWRLKASSQMVPALLYVVVYMRHTSNLEKAIEFAAKNLGAPLSLDFKRIFYEVEIGKYSTIKESLDHYLEKWRGYSSEFIEAFHLIESSLFEPEDARRVATLEKALQVVLDGVYDKMLKFSHNVRSPLTNVYMLGVVLPTLGLALLPLASALLGGILKAYHIFVMFNLIIPFLVYYLTDKVIFLRPGGHGQTELIETNPYYYKYKSKAPYIKAFFICLPFFILGLLPLIFQYTPIPEALGLQKDYTFKELGLNFFGDDKIFGFADGNGPIGFVALLLGMFFPLGVSLFFAIAFKEKTRDLIIARDDTEDLEEEFNNTLFQLGNRIGNGMPPELAFGNVAESAKGLKSEDFFRRVDYNVRQMGMSLDSAIFDKRRGVLVYYPSKLIATSMRILIEASKKGLRIAASSLMSISQYVKNMQKITQRLKDLLAEISSDMRSNMTFLAPLLSGIVVGLAAMITSILTKLKVIEELGGGSAEIAGGLGGVTNLFNVAEMVPSYYLQIFVGIYLIQIIFILTKTLVIVDSGEDKLKRTSEIGKNLKRGIALYFIVAFLSSIALFILAFLVLKF